MADVMNELTLIPCSAAIACNVAFSPFFTRSFISSYALALYFSVALMCAFVAVMVSPTFTKIISCVHHNVNSDIVQILYNGYSVFCAFYHLKITWVHGIIYM